MRWNMRGRNLAAVAIGVAIAFSVLSLAAQPAGETFTATASVKSPTVTATGLVTIQVDRFIADDDREKVVAAVKSNDQAAIRSRLAALDDVGYIELGTRRTPIKYAYSRSTGGGRLVTVVTATPILYLGGALPDAKPKEGFDLALALLVLDARDTGEGELAPATKIKLNESGAIVTDQYGSEVIRLTKIAKVKTGTGTSAQ